MHKGELLEWLEYCKPAYIYIYGLMYIYIYGLMKTCCVYIYFSFLIEGKEDYAYINQSGCYTLSEVNDAKLFEGKKFGRGILLGFSL